MATLALVTLPLSGHIHPMMAAARTLVQAGHRPVVVGPPDLVARIPDDVETLSIGERDFPAGELDRICACLSRMRSVSDMQQMFALVAKLSKFYIEHLPSALERLGADGVIHDQLEPGAGIVGRGFASKHFAHISLACALPMNREPSVPPPFMGWRYRPGAFGHWLNGGYYNVVNWLLKDQCDALAMGAERYGVTKDTDGLEDWQVPWSVDDGLSRDSDLAQGLASLDFPREHPPIYLGPFRGEFSRYAGLDAIAPERDARPLAFISLGTLMGGRTRLLRAMATAAIDRGMQPVVVHGGRQTDPDAMPAGTISRDFLDQRSVMADASAAIIHGGYNSTVDAVAAGLPLVTVPIAFEQSAIAARVERAGLGRSVGARWFDLSQRIRMALDDVMNSEGMRANIRRARFEAMAAPGLDGLVAAVDGALSRGSTGSRAPATTEREPIIARGYVSAE